jgi:diacylglycerol kinase family enzyme
MPKSLLQRLEGEMMPRIDVIATTISGSITDWKKVEKIIPLFKAHGFDDVRLLKVDSHEAARVEAKNSLLDGCQIPISAGGSGTFRAVLEGCMESEVALSGIRLGFLRKGSADLIGKVLNMPDEIHSAINVFAESISKDSYLSADVLRASCESSDEKPRYFIGYGGAEIFGRIPHYTENRHIKYYKGLLGQIFGDLGPFTTGMALSLLEKIIKTPFLDKKFWRIYADGELRAEGHYQAIILVNGHLGPDLPFSNESLASGKFYVFGLRDMGYFKLLSQAKHARKGTIIDEPERWGLEQIIAEDKVELICRTKNPFPINVDGSTFLAKNSMTFKRVAKIPLLKKCGTEP